MDVKCSWKSDFSLRFNFNIKFTISAYTIVCAYVRWVKYSAGPRRYPPPQKSSRLFGQIEVYCADNFSAPIIYTTESYQSADVLLLQYVYCILFIYRNIFLNLLNNL